MANSSSRASQMRFVLVLFLLFISGLMDVASKQMQADSVPQIKYDVFVNFRGHDIRHGFLGYLTEAFHRKQIHAFVDDKLEKGNEIWPSLVGAIQGSSISLTIFSENYTSSPWCLEELVKILECREKYGQIVIPVFYGVNPTDVRNQKGSYGEALAQLEKKYNLTTVQNWKNALTKVANLSGIKSFDYKTEVELLGEIINIVNLVLTSLDKLPPKSSRLIGIDKEIQHLESLLHQESKYVRVVGIWGMGGIGKTTIAEEIFSKLRSKYDGYYFLANVKEESSRHGTIYLKRKLFSALLGEDVEILDHMPRLSNYIKRKIGRMKVLIVLDDVNDSNLPEKLFENHDWFGRGSRIIITTRDKQVLMANKVDDIHQVGALNNSEALELFSLYAFNQNHFDMEYYKLSQMVVNYAKGIPLVLKVLGRLLCGKDKEVWESQLHKLENMPNTDIYNTMRLSFDDLDRKEQQILLDLACFFIGLNLKLDHIKVLLKDSERDDSVVAGLERLKDKALITISEDNVISMHDIIQEMAWEIVRQESIEDPGNRSRLIDPNDIYEVLKYNKATEAIRSIRASLPVIQKVQLSPHVFTKMSKLQFFYLRKSFDLFFLPPRGFQSFPAELRYLSWWNYPLISLPENFSAENLVIFDLSGSPVLKLWDGVQNLMNLKVLSVAGCRNLKELPDLSKATNLEFLDISFSQLSSVNPSIFSLKKLETLSFHHCSLNTLISDNHLTSLRYVNLLGCKALSQFSVTSENMIELDLSFTSVTAFPSTFGRQSNLKILNLVFNCIESFPSSFKNLTGLRYLNVERSRKLHTLSLTELPASLGVLDATHCTSLKTVYFPSIAEQFNENRREILFWNCLELDEHSLKAIGLNARINVMKSAYHNLSATGKKNVDFYLRYSRSYQVKYVYPGSSIPEWLEYKTTKDYLIIDLSSTPPSTLLGFIFSFVIAEPKDHNRAVFLEYPFYITVSEGEGESEKDGIDIYVSHRVRVESGVCVMYDQECSHYLHNRAKNQTRLTIKVTIKEAAPSDSKRGLELKGFGVTPVTSSVYHNFIQEINSSVDHSFNQQVNTSADHSLIQQLNISVDHSFIQQINSSANHSFIQQTNSSENHSFIQQINTSADRSFIQQVNFSADHIFIQQMEVPSYMLFTQILAIIIILLIPFWLLVVKRRRL